MKKQKTHTSVPASASSRGKAKTSNSVSSSTAGTARRSWRERLVGFPPMVALFALLWAFLSITYESVFYIAEQYSFLVADDTLMFSLRGVGDAWLIVVGRFLMLLFHYSWLGGAILALILSLTVWMLVYICRARGPWRIALYVLPFVLLAYYVNQGLGLYYEREVGYILAYPFLFAVGVTLVALVLRLVTKRKMDGLFINRGETPMVEWTQILAILLLFIALNTFALKTQDNTIATTRMERMMEDEDWQGMIDVAKACSHPSRPVACYYAIALTQTDQLTTNLFDIHYQYPDIKLKGIEGQRDPGIDYFSLDGNFFAGLVNSAYHDSMERMSVDGPSKKRIKRMYLCSLANGEMELADKYLRIIKKMPFEGRFVERYGSYLGNRWAVMRDPMFSRILETLPLIDNFEQAYMQPLLVGYNVGLTEVRSMRALHNSVMACLYAKMLPKVYDRMAPLRGQNLPRYYEDALALFNNMEQRASLTPFRLKPFTIPSLKAFFSNVGPSQGEDKKATAQRIRPTYGAYYPFYFYFQNIPDENYDFGRNSETGNVN